MNKNLTLNNNQNPDKSVLEKYFDKQFLSSLLFPPKVKIDFTSNLVKVIFEYKNNKGYDEIVMPLIYKKRFLDYILQAKEYLNNKNKKEVR